MERKKRKNQVECKSFLCRAEGSTATTTSLPHNYDNCINNTSHRKTSRRHRPSRRSVFRTAVLTSFLQFSASSRRDTPPRHLTHGRGRQSPAGGSAAAVRAEQPLNATVGGGSEGGRRKSIANVRNKSVPVCCEAPERRFQISLRQRTSFQRRWGSDPAEHSPPTPPPSHPSPSLPLRCLREEQTRER